MRVRLAIMLVVFAAGCGGSDGTSPPSNKNKTVDIYTVADSYSPTPLTIAVGDTIRWNFAGGSDGMGHNVRFFPITTGSPSDINVLKTGTASRVFSTKGDFKYVCDVHPGMNGEVVVQ